MGILSFQNALLMANPHLETASGAIATFNTDMQAPLKSLKVNIDVKQSGSGDPSPTNIRPLVGMTELNVYDDPVYGGSIDWNQYANAGLTAWNTSRLTVSTTDGVTTFKTTSGSSLKSARREFPANHKVLVTASDVELNVSGMAYVGVYNGATATGYSTRIVLDDGSFARILNIDDSYTSNRLTIGFGTGAAAGNTIVMTNLQIFDLTQMFGVTVANQIFAMEEEELGSGVQYFRTLFPFEPYDYIESEIASVSEVNGIPYTHISVSWQTEAGTVYGGTLTVNNDGSGTLIVDSREVQITEPPATLERYGSGRYFVASLGIGRNTLKDSETVCNAYPFNGAISSNNDFIGTSVGYSSRVGYDSFFIRPTDFSTTTLDDMKNIITALNDAGTPLTYVVHLKTANTYQLTVPQVRTLLGTNNIWADTGNVEVRYWKH